MRPRDGAGRSSLGASRSLDRRIRSVTTTTRPKEKAQFGEWLMRELPRGAVVLVVSKGDPNLLELPGIDARHFPQRSDGVYAGYHPVDSHAAIAHLQSLQRKGAGFIVFPAAARWWLEHYDALKTHLETAHRLLADTELGVLYKLEKHPTSTPRERRAGADSATAPAPGDDDWLVKAQALIDLDHYGAQVGKRFESAEEAIEHYRESPAAAVHSPHPLFDSQWYATRYPRQDSLPPFLAFLREGAAQDHDPSPFFDTSYYYSQRPGLRARGVNPLLHYVEHRGIQHAAHPNPLFRGGFYIHNNPEAATRTPTPFQHYLRYGLPRRAHASPVHRSIVGPLRRSSRGLRRGDWRSGVVLIVAEGLKPLGWPRSLALGASLAAHHFDPVVVTAQASPADELPHADGAAIVALEDYELACEIRRRSALRLLLASLSGALAPRFALTDSMDAAEMLTRAEVETMYLAPPSPDPGDFESRTALPARVLARSTKAAAAIPAYAHRQPAPLIPRTRTARGVARAICEMVKTEDDVGVPVARSSQRPGAAEKLKIVIPCPDWSVSGVNAALEAVSRHLLDRGWEVELLFTRSESVVTPSDDARYMPDVPYRFLNRPKPGVFGLWEALIADLESQAPCIVLTGYDFLANAVTSALTDRIGVVSWIQADDGDYYEQAYRLGLYCNALVCVSHRIRERITGLNPLVGERCHVIHNSSVSATDVKQRRRQSRSVLRIAYSGRLVQYQKRILDFADLADALESRGVPFEITLIGTFSAYEPTEQAFAALASRHIQDGRIRLLGRMTREAILKELARNDFFVLLSDFEGLPLSLIEAMARGCVPVTAQMESGIPELVRSGANGFIVSGRDYRQWADLLTSVWRDRKRVAGLSRAARATVARGFTIERVGSQFEALLVSVSKDVLAGRYSRMPALTWGARSQTGDVVPPPNLQRPSAARIAGLED